MLLKKKIYIYMYIIQTFSNILKRNIHVTLINTDKGGILAKT